MINNKPDRIQSNSHIHYADTNTYQALKQAGF